MVCIHGLHIHFIYIFIASSLGLGFIIINNTSFRSFTGHNISKIANSPNLTIINNPQRDYTNYLLILERILYTL
jgi:hypothetical protein